MLAGKDNKGNLILEEEDAEAGAGGANGNSLYTRPVDSKKEMADDGCLPRFCASKGKTTRSNRTSDSDEMKKVCLDDFMPGFCVVLVVSVVGIIIAVVAGSLTTVDPTDTGLTYNSVQAKLGTEALQQGLQTKPTFGTTVLWPAKYTTVSFENDNSLQCNSQDGLLIKLDISFQFVAVSESLRELTLAYQNFSNYETMLMTQAASTVTHVCGDFSAEEFQTNRSDVSEAMRRDVSSQLESRFQSKVAQFQLRNIDRPVQYEDVVKEKENARSDIRLANNERQQALTKANTLLAQAEQERATRLDTAQANSDVTVRSANAFMEGVLGRYASFAQVYSSVKSLYNLTNAGVLTYLSNELFVGSDSTIAVEAPSQVTFSSEL